MAIQTIYNSFSYGPYRAVPYGHYKNKSSWLVAVIKRTEDDYVTDHVRVIAFSAQEAANLAMKHYEEMAEDRAECKAIEKQIREERIAQGTEARSE